jgi:hypothetical protein
MVGSGRRLIEALSRQLPGETDAHEEPWENFFSSVQSPDLKPTQPPQQRAPEPKENDSSRCISETKNVWNYTSIPTYFMA